MTRTLVAIGPSQNKFDTVPHAHKPYDPDATNVDVLTFQHRKHPHTPAVVHTSVENALRRESLNNRPNYRDILRALVQRNGIRATSRLTEDIAYAGAKTPDADHARITVVLRKNENAYYLATLKEGDSLQSALMLPITMATKLEEKIQKGSLAQACQYAFYGNGAPVESQGAVTISAPIASADLSSAIQSSGDLSNSAKNTLLKLLTKASAVLANPWSIKE